MWSSSSPSSCRRDSAAAAAASMAMKPLCSPLAALLSACCCAALALALPHYHPASPHCFPAPAPETFAFSPLADNITIPLAGDLSLTVFRQLSFLLLPNSSFSSSFTLTFNQTLTDAPFIQPAGLFLLFLPPPSSPSLSASSAPPPPASAFDIQVCFVCVEQNASSQIYFPPICNSTQIGVEMNVSLVLGGDPQLGEGLFKDELSLQYAAATGELHLTAAQYGQDEVVTIDLSLSNLDADAGNESTRLLVGYLAETEAIITVQAANDTDAAAPSTELNSGTTRLAASGSATSKKHTRLIWITSATVVGASVLLGIAVLAMVMRRRRRVEAVPSPARQTATPSEACEVPMMRNLSLAAPDYSAFEVTGTASWLKLPEPR